PELVSDSPETNHERTLYVRYLFRNPLIWGEQLEGSQKEAFNRPAGRIRKDTRPWRRGRAGSGSPGNRRRRAGPAWRNPASEMALRPACRRAAPMWRAG